MNSLLKSLMVVGMLLGSFLLAAEFPIYFQPTQGPVKEFTPPVNSEIAMANAAFLQKYGKETGVLGTAEGVKGELVILVSDMQVATVVWNKLVQAGDAYNNAGVGYFRYSAPPVMPAEPFKFVGRISIPENTTGRFIVANGTPLTKMVSLVMDRSCAFNQVQVETVNNVPVMPTQLVKTVLTAGNGIAYEFNINGGAGALLSSVVISMGLSPTPLSWVKICPMDVYFR